MKNWRGQCSYGTLKKDELKVFQEQPLYAIIVRDLRVAVIVFISLVDLSEIVGLMGTRDVITV